jgi:HEAT repeat protein
MTNVILDEYDLRELPPRERLDKIKEILKNEKEDESIRWDAVWLAGEIIDTANLTLFDPMQAEIAEFMIWVLRNEKNGIVKHEAAFQIGLRNMRDKIPELYNTIENDESDVARHEAIEALGLMRVQTDECKKLLTRMSQSPNKAVSETAIFVLKRLERLKDKGEYQGEAIL